MIEPKMSLQVLRDLPVGVLVQRADASIAFANVAALDLLGLTEDEIMGRSSFDPTWNVVHNDGSPFPGPTHPVPVAIATRKSVTDVIMGVWRPRHGDRAWLMVTAHPRLDADGEVADCLCTFSDITLEHEQHRIVIGRADILERAVAQRTAELTRTVAELSHEIGERVKAEGELAQREALQASVLRSMSEGVVLYAEDGSIQLSNPAASIVLGLSSDQIKGRTAIDSRWRLVRDDGSALPTDEIPSEITRKTGRSLRARIVGVHKPGGELRWLSVSTDPVGGTQKPGPHAVVMSITDITASRATTLALEQQRARSAQVADAVPGVLIELSQRDTTWAVTFVSGQALPVLGLKVGDLTANAEPLFGRLHPDDAQMLRERLAADDPRGQSIDLEVRVQRHRDATGWVRVRAVPARGDDGVRWTGFLMDVTEEHQMAEGLRLTQRREAMTSLSAGVAHNFNNMLAAILPNLQIALQYVDGTQADLPLRDAISAANSAASLVHQLLLASRAEPDERRSFVDVRDPLREAVGICRRTFDRGIELTIEVSDHALPVLGTSSLLHQVFFNLLINARDAVEHSAAAQITARALPTTLQDGRPGASIIVRDNGVGMSAEVQAHLGEPFFTTKEVGRGTGLGIPMVYGIVADLGGSVAVHSVQGAGTTFTILVPLTDVGPTPTPSPPASMSVLSGRRVLVVDDEPLIRRTLARVLERMGMHVQVAKDGPQALELATDDLDVVLLDSSMPGMNGAQVLERLAHTVPRVPVVIVTGYVDLVQGLERAHTVLKKPVSGQDLARVLTEIIAG